MARQWLTVDELDCDGGRPECGRDQQTHDTTIHAHLLTATGDRLQPDMYETLKKTRKLCYRKDDRAMRRQK